MTNPYKEMRKVYFYNEDIGAPQQFDVFEEDFGGYYLLAPVGTNQPDLRVKPYEVFDTAEQCLVTHRKKLNNKIKLYDAENKDVDHIIANLFFTIISKRQVSVLEMQTMMAHAKELFGNDFEKVLDSMTVAEQKREEARKKRMRIEFPDKDDYGVKDKTNKMKA